MSRLFISWSQNLKHYYYDSLQLIIIFITKNSLKDNHTKYYLKLNPFQYPVTMYDLFIFTTIHNRSKIWMWADIENLSPLVCNKTHVNKMKYRLTLIKQLKWTTPMPKVDLLAPLHEIDALKIFFERYNGCIMLNPIFSITWFKFSIRLCTPIFTSLYVNRNLTKLIS